MTATTPNDPSAEDVAGDVAEARAQHLPPADFSTFILSMAAAFSDHAGQVRSAADAATQRYAKAMAAHTLELLTVIEEKTKGNLNGQEERLLAQVLFDLRVDFIKLP